MFHKIIKFVDLVTPVFRRKCIALNAYSRKDEKFKTNAQGYRFKSWGKKKERQIKPKVNTIFKKDKRTN